MKKNKVSTPSLKLARNRIKKDINYVSYKLEYKYKDLGKGRKYFISTYGCQGNEADSEIMAGILEDIGFKKAIDYNDANLVILNTCAIRENAENRIWGVLGNLKSIKESKEDFVIGICGCMPQEENATNKLLESYPYVDMIFGTHTIKNLASLIYNVYRENQIIVDVVSDQGELFEAAPKIREHKHKAWINIMFGCDEFCTYCIVPYTRGRERSRRKEDIINEVKDLVSKGYTEVTLLGQNVNAYGKDCYSDYSFGNLLYDLDKTGIKRIRYTTSHPRDLDDLTIYAMRDCTSVMPHLHLPVQSGSNEVLKAMNRKYTREEYLEKVNKLKKEVPGISLTTDIIVGFPNETEEQFKETLSLVKEVQFEGAFTFIYSKREGTPAAKMQDNVSLSDKNRRLQELNKLVNEGYLNGSKRFLGEIVEVLVDGVSKNNPDALCGYSKHLKLVHFNSKDLSLIGTLQKVRITEAKTWFLIGELVE